MRPSSVLSVQQNGTASVQEWGWNWVQRLQGLSRPDRWPTEVSFALHSLRILYKSIFVVVVPLFVCVMCVTDKLLLMRCLLTQNNKFVVSATRLCHVRNVENILLQSLRNLFVHVQNCSVVNAMEGIDQSSLHANGQWETNENSWKTFQYNSIKPTLKIISRETSNNDIAVTWLV